MRPVVNPNQRETNMKFKVVKVVGKGSYGTVYQVQRLSDNKTYALKEMDVRSMNQAEREDSANEIRLLASVQHPNVIAYNEAFLDGNKLCIIMDFAPEGDLAKVIKKYTMLRQPMPEELVWKYFVQICCGLLALHNMKILHRDIKPGNIMIMENDVAKIGDLGIAKVLSKTVAAKTQIGTPHYMPPEIWKNRPYGFQSDSWAIGCLLYEMMTLKVPFEARNINELKNKVLRGSYPPVPSSYSRELQQFVRECLDQAPERRPTMDQIMGSQAVQSRLHLMPTYAKEKARPSRSSAGSVMLDTIKVPRNFQLLKGKLPPAQYGAEAVGMIEEGDEDEGRSDAGPRVGGGAGNPRLPLINPGRGGMQRPPMGPTTPPARAPVPQQLQPRMPPVPGVQPARGGAFDPVLAEMQQKAAMIGNMYNAYEKRPPVASSEAKARAAYLGGLVDDRPWYAKQPAPGSQISESRAAYGAFYYSPKIAGPVQVAQVRSQLEAAMQGGGQYNQPKPQYKGYYTPSEAPTPYAQYGGYEAGGGARAGNWAAAQPRLQPVAQRQPARGGNNAPSKPPPWNFGGGNSKAALTPTKNAPGHLGGGHGVQGQHVERYPPMQWAPPRMR